MLRLSPCFLHCCQPWYCSSLSASWPLSPQRLHPGHWAERLYLRSNQNKESFCQLSVYHTTQSLLKTVPCFTWEQQVKSKLWATGVNQVPSDVSIRTSTSLKIPRRSSLSLATWALFITWKKTSAVIYGSQSHWDDRDGLMKSRILIHTSMRFLAWKTSEIS